MSDENITIIIRMNTSVRFTIGSTVPLITSSNTVLQLKQIIAGHESSGRCPVERQRLIYKGRILNDDTKTLGDYGISGNDQTVHLVKGSAPTPTSGNPPTNRSFFPSSTTGGATSSPAGAGNSNANFNTIQHQSQSLPTNMSQMQQQLLQNPDMTRSLMNSPMMQNLMSNPDFIRTMMDSNPQMREVLDANPELRNLLDDPDMMARSMEMMRDPNAMQNMMRNQDLAMSQIENIPGGFSALRRMYEDVQEPMIDALSNSNNTSNSDSNSGGTSNAGSGAAGTAMPNPWASNGTSRTSAGTSTGTSTSSTPPTQMQYPPNPWATAGTAPNGMNMEQTISMLENPAISQMMNQIMADPTIMQSMMDNNPMLRQMRETNPQVAAMLSNPEMMRAMMNPENLRAMNQMQSAMQNLGQGIPGFPSMPLATGGVLSSSNQTAAGNSGMDFSSLLNQFQSTTVSGSSTPSSQREEIPPEQRYRMQLQSLNDMGFDDNEANIRALTQTRGNVNRSVELLLTGPPSEEETSTPSAPHTSISNNLSGSDTTDNDSSDKKNN